MKPRRECEALIVGAGPVGMCGAAFLAREGVRTQILEEGHRPAARSYALALHPSTLALLDELGLAEPLVERGEIVDRIVFYDGSTRRLELETASLETRFPFILVLAQDQLEDILSRYLRRANIPVFWNHRAARFGRLGPGMIEVDVERIAHESAGYGLRRGRSTLEPPTSVHTFFVIGADGSRSLVRRALALEYREMAPARTFGIFEFQAQWNPHSAVRIVLEDGSSSVLWPLGDGRFRWSFELTEQDRASPRLKRRLLVQMGEEAFPYVAQDLLEDLIERRAPWFDAAPREVTWSVALRFEQRLVEHFGRGTVWLAGDAAHLAPPIGVHSMNLGIEEARSLTQRLRGILRNGDPSECLAKYDVERRAAWEEVFHPESHFESTNGDDWRRRNAGHILSAIPASGGDLQSLAAQAGFARRKPDRGRDRSAEALLEAI